MTSLERVLESCRHRATNRVPIGPFAGFYAARMTGVPLGRYVMDGRHIADAQIALQRRTGQDIVLTAADAYYLAEGYGLKVRYYNEALPTCEEALLKSLGEADDLPVLDPLKDGRMPVYLDALERLVEAVGDRVAVRCTGTGPFSIAAYLYGMQDFLALLAEIESGEADEGDEAAVHRLIGRCAETSAAFLVAQVEAGAHLIYLGDSLASCDMISPAMYRKYAQPHHRAIFERVKEVAASRDDVFTLLHICGNNSSLLEDLAATGVDVLEIDQKLDLADCKRRIGGRVTLIGNLDPTQTILRGTPDLVRQQSVEAITKAGAGGGFILGTGCFVPYDSPIENLKAMVEAAETFGASNNIKTSPIGTESVQKP